MKKLGTILLCVLALSLLLTGCPLGEPAEPQVAAAPDIAITVGEVAPGMTVGQIPVEVTLNGEPTACTAEWVIFSEDGFGYLEPTDTIPAGFHGRLDVTYFLPKGVEVTGDLPITVNAPGGTYDGTGEGATNEEGCIAAWSHIMYELPKPVAAPEILITVPELKAGMIVGQIPVEVTLNGEPTACTTEWVIFGEDGFGYLEPTDTIPAGYDGRLDVTYFLPKGVEVTGDLPVTLNAPGGTYDGTGEGATNEEGCIAAWSHIMYELPKPVAAPQILITVPELKAGMTVGQIPVTVTLDGVETPCTTEWVVFSEDGFGYLEPTDTIPAGFYGRLDVTYFLPKGVEVTGDLPITVNAPGGTYDGTGEGATNEEGCIAAWSHIMYELPASEEEGEHKHNWVENKDKSKKATCESDGYKYMECSECGKHTRKEIAALGHDYSVEKKHEEPTCTKDGVLEMACKRCGDVKRETRKALGHKHTVKKKDEAPTCTRDGVLETACERCGDIKREVRKATGHDYSNKKVQIEPTCTRTGVQLSTCAKCGDQRRDEIPATGHKWSAYYYWSGTLHYRTCSQCDAREEGRHEFDKGSIRCKLCNNDIVNSIGWHGVFERAMKPFGLRAENIVKIAKGLYK